MSLLSKENTWTLVSTAVAIAAATAVRNGLQKGWKHVKDEDPPQNPAASDVGWTDALLWTVLVGATVGVARLLARRGAAAGWEKATGKEAPGL